MSTCPRCKAPLMPGVPCPTCDDGPGHRCRVTMSSTIGPGKARALSVTLDLPIEFLARFELFESLGKGGMGEVFRAKDLSAGREVAIKFCIAHTVPGARERFEQEAALMARIRHPYVVGVLETGLVEKTPYLVMPLVRGQSLRSILGKRGRLPVEEAVRLTLQMLDALDASHHEGVIHRDLKPENVLVTPAGEAMLLDLGVAKSWADGSAAKDTQQITGTPAYMSPEQAKGMPTGVASDLYSAGIILFEMLAGQPPFSAPTAMGILRAHIEERIPRVTERCESLESHWDHVLARALAKSPSDRFSDAKAFSVALEKAAAGQYAVSCLPAINDLEKRGVLSFTKDPVSTAVGIGILTSLVCTSFCALAELDFPLAVSALLPISSIFLTEEPGRFQQLSARGSVRAVVWVATVTATVGLLLVGSRDPFLQVYLIFWTLLAVHLGWFGGYHTRDPKDRDGVSLHRRAHTLVTAATTVIVVSFGTSTAIGFASLATALALLGAIRPPARTRHLSIGTATTMILMRPLASGEAEPGARPPGEPDPLKSGALRFAHPPPNPPPRTTLMAKLERAAPLELPPPRKGPVNAGCVGPETTTSAPFVEKGGRPLKRAGVPSRDQITTARGKSQA